MTLSKPAAKITLPVAIGAALARREAFYRFGLLATAVLPPTLSYPMARWFGRLRYRGLWHRNEGRRRSLSVGLRVDREQADTLLDEFFQYWASDDLDSILYRILPAQRLATLIEVRGLENLDAALANGRGAILYSGHVHGQYTLLAALGLRGYRPTMVRLGIEAAFSPLRRWLFLNRCAVLSQKYDCRFIVMFYQRPAHWRSESKQLTSFDARAADARNRITPRSRDLIVQALAR